MAEVEEREEMVEVEELSDIKSEPLDIKSLLSGEGRDFLVRNNGDQVKIDNLEGKLVGLYFSASWCGPCRRFTPKLIKTYDQLSTNGDFEVVFVSGDSDEKSFEDYFHKMPWLAIPFSDSTVRSKLDEGFEVYGIPHLVIVGKDSKILTSEGVGTVSEYGVDGYPFTNERLEELKEQDEEIRQNQNLRTLLVTDRRDFVISNDGRQIPISELEGKTIGLYFAVSGHPFCEKFTPELIEVYKKLKEKGESFEIVLVSSDENIKDFNEHFSSMPWLALPFEDIALSRLRRLFELQGFPTLTVIGPDGKTLKDDVVETIGDHGPEAYPFTPERFIQLAEIEKKRLESMTLESLLMSDDGDFIIGKGGIKVPISELVGKNVCLYFSAEWCPPCRAFLPKLIEAYNEIKANDSNFEIVFISSDQDQGKFDEFFSSMPWLALPFGDKAKEKLSRTFKIRGIPSLVALDKKGRLVTNDARNLIMRHGSKAFPFTEERLKEVEQELEEMAKGWPKELKLEVHSQHPLMLISQRWYTCDGCNEGGNGWSYYCKECDYDLHPKCALKEKDKIVDSVDEVEMEKTEEEGKIIDGAEGENGHGEGWVCDGEACRKA
ncbi:hypothetical protein AMTRI_Chr12g233980 [Amborella trichopoda]